MLDTLGEISCIISRIINRLRCLMPRMLQRLKTYFLSCKTIYPLVKVISVCLPLTILGGLISNSLGMSGLFNSGATAKNLAGSATETLHQSGVSSLPADFVLPPLKMPWQPGLTILHQTVTIDQQGQPVSFRVIGVLVDPQNSHIRLKPLLANDHQVTGAAPLHVMAEKSGAVAAINAGFFNRQRQMPVGAIRRDGQWQGGVVLHRGAVAWRDAQPSEPENSPQFFFDRLKASETLSGAGQVWQLMPSNSGYVQPGIARYSPAWGANYLPITENELIFTVKGNSSDELSDQIVEATKMTKVNERPIPIPSDGYLLIARSFNALQQRDLMAILSPETLVSVALKVTPSAFNQYPHIIGAGPLLLKNSQVVLNAKVESFTAGFDRQGADRSVIAKLSDGQILLAVVQDMPDSIAPDLHQTAAVLQQLGAVDALNLDGGSSTSLYAQGSILNRSLANVAPVHSAIGIWVVP